MILSPIHHRQSDLRKLYLIGGCSYKRFCSNYCSQVTIIQNPTKSKQIRYNVTQTVYKLKPARSFWLFSGLSLFILFLSSQLVTITIKCILSKKPFVKDNQSTQLFIYIYIYIHIYIHIYIYTYGKKLNDNKTIFTGKRRKYHYIIYIKNCFGKFDI